MLEFCNIVYRGLLDNVEVTKLKHCLEHDEGIMSHKYERDDSEGRKSKSVLWNQLANDVTGIIARSEKVAGTFEKVRTYICFQEIP